MAVPDYQTLMLPVLRLIANGRTNVADCLDELKEEFGISDDEAADMLPSGRVTVLSSRTHWARTYLSKAGMLHSPKRNVHEITDIGRRLLAQNPDRIDNSVLAEFDDFAEWRRQSRRENDDPTTERAGEDLQSDIVAQYTPNEQIDQAISVIANALLDDVLSRVLEISPQRFERLIVELLVSMGYGRGLPDSGRAIGRSGDGGIDGVINEDALGLDAVYIQAKRYALDSKVGRPAIQQFIGSLTGESATKGVFVTTSDFSSEARGYVEKVQQRVVLINGQQLARLMIEHGIGVRTEQTFVLRAIDEGYFLAE